MVSKEPNIFIPWNTAQLGSLYPLSVWRKSYSRGDASYISHDSVAEALWGSCTGIMALAQCNPYRPGFEDCCRRLSRAQPGAYRGGSLLSGRHGRQCFIKAMATISLIPLSVCTTWLFQSSCGHTGFVFPLHESNKPLKRYDTVWFQSLVIKCKWFLLVSLG